MTKEYIDKLIELAEELEKYHVMSPTNLETMNFGEKLSYLLGYILALKEFKDSEKGTF